LPYPDYAKTARSLDRQRLGKQRVEAKQIITALESRPGEYGWQNHPAVLMWRGYIPALARYGLAICDEWIGRGYRDSLREFFAARVTDDPDPPWLGGQIHATHRYALHTKKPEHYPAYFADEPGPYHWPVEKTA
jgi:hypothetical protein